MLAALRRALAFEGELFLKYRKPQLEEQYQKLDAKEFELSLREGGARFWVELATHLDTGLFLDHRGARDQVSKICQGKSVLNLFSYTGAFAVRAAVAGAQRTLSVDLSKTYSRWAVRNFAANSIAAPLRTEIAAISGRGHEQLQGDVLSFIEDKPREQFDIIVCDPPSYSVSKRMQRRFEIAKDHPKLLYLLKPLLKKNGQILFSTNKSKFKLISGLSKAFKVEELTSQWAAEDVRQRPPHRLWRLAI